MVCRFWEHEINKSVVECVDKVMEKINEISKNKAAN